MKCRKYPVCRCFCELNFVSYRDTTYTVIKDTFVRQRKSTIVSILVLSINTRIQNIAL